MWNANHTMGDSNCQRVICTNFGATLDLMAAEKDNSLVNNHVVICIWFVAYNWRLNYIITYYNLVQITSNLELIPQHIVWIDNRPTQYKCRHNFLKVVTFAKSHNSKSIVTHKFAQKYIFISSWDATGKIVEQKILNNELKS